MTPADRDVVHVVAAVIEDDGRFLLALRAAGKSLAGHWEFPGGKVEVGEDPRLALARELEEELSAKGVNVDSPVGRRQHDYGNIKVLIDAYRVTCNLRSLRPLEHERIGWFSPAQMRAILLAPADEFLIPMLTTACQRAP